MEKGIHLFYTNRIKTGLLGILCFGIAYMIYTQLLLDTQLLTDTAVVFMNIVFIIDIVLGCSILFKTIDPRPILEITRSGVTIQSFLFTKAHISWDEITSVNNENFKQFIVSPSAFAFTNTRILRFKRVNGRSVAVNLTLLNTKGVDIAKLIQSLTSDV